MDAVQSVQLAVKRWVVLGIVFAMLAAIALSVASPLRSSKNSNAEIDTRLLLLSAQLCDFENAVASKDFVTAKNLYWDKLHINVHALDVRLREGDKALENSFLIAHGKVETDIATLAPGLVTDGRAFASQTRRALAKLGIVGAMTPC